MTALSTCLWLLPGVGSGPLQRGLSEERSQSPQMRASVGSTLALL